MFSRMYLIFVLFVSSLVSSDDRAENKSQTGFNDFEKKVVIPFVVGLAVTVISHKTAFLVRGDKLLLSELEKDQQLSYFEGCFKSVPLTILCANLKVIPFFAVNTGTISLENAKRICHLVSVGHGFLAARLCQWSLNRFFPG